MYHKPKSRILAVAGTAAVAVSLSACAAPNQTVNNQIKQLTSESAYVLQRTDLEVGNTYYDDLLRNQNALNQMSFLANGAIRAFDSAQANGQSGNAAANLWLYAQTHALARDSVTGANPTAGSVISQNKDLFIGAGAALAVLVVGGAMVRRGRRRDDDETDGGADLHLVEREPAQAAQPKFQGFTEMKRELRFKALERRWRTMKAAEQNEDETDAVTGLKSANPLRTFATRAAAVAVGTVAWIDEAQHLYLAKIVGAMANVPPQFRFIPDVALLAGSALAGQRAVRRFTQAGRAKQTKSVYEMERYAEDGSDKVVKKLTANPNIPTSLLRDVEQNNPNERIRKMAKKRLEHKYLSQRIRRIIGMALSHHGAEASIDLEDTIDTTPAPKQPDGPMQNMDF